ncbi:MAG TPA: sensor histidine kinase [Flavobacteriia bacterium]|nr:sensor histidine kinase [Flavobacteriia bacterium]
MKFKFLIVSLLIFATSFAQKKPDKELFALYDKKCHQFIKKRQLDSTKIYINKIDELLDKLNDSTYYYKAELIKGTLLTLKSDYDNSMKKLLKATQFFKIQNDLPNYYSGTYHIGVCYYYVNRRKDAQVKMNEVVRNAQYVPQQMKINALSNLGAVEMELGMLNNKPKLIKNSKINLRKAITLNLKHKSYAYVTSNYSLLAEAYNQLGDKPTALKLLDSAVYYSKLSKDYNSEAFALIKKSHILTVKKQYKNALKSINKAISIYDKGKHIPTKIYAFIEKKKLLVAMKNYKDANAISDSIYNLSIKNYDKRFADGISEMTVKYKTAEKERKILEQRADIAEKGLLLQKKNYQIFGFVGLLLLLGVFGYFFYKQQQLKQQQLVKENQLKIALREIETQNKLQEQRLRISRDLHDNIGAQLSFIISSIDNLKFLIQDPNPKLKDKLTYISSFTTATIHQLRDTIWAMNKNELTIEDLHSRILSFLENAKKANNNKVNIQLEFNVKSKDITFTSIKGINIFRVVQEAINNALKYANAKSINISIQEKNQELIFKILDDGNGFDIQKVNLGNGLRNMKDRIVEIDGKLNISSNNNGTIIQIICNKNTTNKA